MTTLKYTADRTRGNNLSCNREYSARRELKASLTWFCNSRTSTSACMVLLHVRRAKQAKTTFLRDGPTMWKVAERRGERTRNLSLRLLVPPVKALGSIVISAVQALKSPNYEKPDKNEPSTKLAFPVWHTFFKFKFELRGKTVSKKNTNGKIPGSKSRARYPKIAQPVTCETRKCSTQQHLTACFCRSRLGVS